MALAQPGDLSAPVRVDGGICILRYAADVPRPGPVAFEAVRDALLDTYEAELKTSQYNATVVQWVQGGRREVLHRPLLTDRRRDRHAA